MVLHFQAGLKGIHKLLEDACSKTMANMNIVSSANIQIRKQSDVHKEKEEERKGEKEEMGEGYREQVNLDKEHMRSSGWL